MAKHRTHRTHSIAFKRQVVQEYLAGETLRNLSTTLRHRRFLFTDSFLLLWKWRVG